MSSASNTDRALSADYVAIPLDHIPLEVELPFALFVRVASKYVKFREVGDTLTTQRLGSLEKKTDAVYIPVEMWSSFLTYLEKACDVDVPDRSAAAKNVRKLLLTYAQHIEQSVIMDRGTVGKIRNLAYQLARLICENPKLSGVLLHRYRDYSIYFCTHNLNVAVYSVAMGKKMGLSLQDLQLLAFSCLVHNAGNLLLPRELLYKNGSLTEAEVQRMRSHSLSGAQLLEYLQCPTEVVLTAKQHHERVDGGGYPQGLWGAEIHLFAKICAIADVYDALVSHRPGGRPPLVPKDAVRAMQEMKGHFDPKILPMIGNA